MVFHSILNILIECGHQQVNKFQKEKKKFIFRSQLTINNPPPFVVKLACHVTLQSKSPF